MESVIYLDSNLDVDDIVLTLRLEVRHEIVQQLSCFCADTPDFVGAVVA